MYFHQITLVSGNRESQSKERITFPFRYTNYSNILNRCQITIASNGDWTIYQTEMHIEYILNRARFFTKQ